MGLEKTKAIVLRVVEFSETSCIVTMMTRDHGKITAMAKGARRPKSPFESALDVLSVCRIVFLKKASGGMDLLTEAKLERRFRSGSTNLSRLYAGYYVAELLKLLTEDADPHADLYDIAIQTLERIDQSSDDVANESATEETIMNFELGALSCLGHLPMLTQCVSCGKEKTTVSRVSFGMNAGGILCQKCRLGKQNIVSLSQPGFQFLLEQMKRSTESGQNYLEIERSDTVQERAESYRLNSENAQHAPTTPDERTTEEVRSLIRNYITHLIGYPPRLQKYLTNNKRTIASASAR